MRYRNVGASGLKVSEIGLGTGDNAGALVHGDAKAQHDLVEGALEAGINLFDTAPDYGKGCAEVNLGRVLQELSVKDPVIITKVGILPDNIAGISAKIEQSINDSLLRLRRSDVEIIMLHNPCRGERDQSSNKQHLGWTPLTSKDILDHVLPVFIKAREAGKVRQFALNCDCAAEPEAVRPLFASGEFSLFNVVYNLANPSAAWGKEVYAKDGTGEGLLDNYAGLFDLAAEYKVSANVIRPLAGGALTSPVIRNGLGAMHELSRGWFKFQPNVANPAIKIARQFQFLDEGDAGPISQAAYRFILQHPVVASVSGGFSDLSQLREAAEASAKGPLGTVEQEKVEAVHRQFRSAVSQ